MTDPFAARRRPVDVALLDGTGRVHFEQLAWPRSLDAVSLASAFPREADVVVVDGPQALAAPGRAVRECERLLRAPGRTADVLPALGRPYGGFLRGSVLLFDALERSGARLCGPDADLLEAFPGASWARLHQALPPKATREGRRARRRILEREGLVFSRSLPTHDQLDGALCAWLGLLWLSKSDRLRHVGEAPRRLGGWLREGRIVDFRAESVGDSTRRAGRARQKCV